MSRILSAPVHRSSSQTNAGLAGASRSKAPRAGVAIQESSPSITRLTLSAGDEWSLHSVVVNDTEYRQVLLDEGQSYGQSGAPDVPVFKTIVAVPDCDSVTLEMTVRSTSTVSDVRIAPGVVARLVIHQDV
jgi:hypothetical protein